MKNFLALHGLRVPRMASAPRKAHVDHVYVIDGRKRAAALGVLVSVLLLVAGCTDRTRGDDVAEQGYISGDGTVRQVEVAERDDPVTFAGTTLDGEPIEARDLRGQVVVLNVWASWCPPCIAEADDLQQVWDETKGDGVAFVGINFKDQTAAALAHEKRFGVTYPSIEDEAGRVLLALRGSLPPNAVPSTLVLDRRGRVAARVLGQVSTGTLRALVEDVQSERRSAVAG
jgi:thiol-disulfide isomerase/thioredoxin